ncbi:DNA-binding protein [Gallibacterium salpingitidis]|uniref:DNA-binding protein n=1 Tax=Gallibacterium salpingitidis TaxID=505341 RepID=A0AB36E4K5_9PAST|nr:AlpA family transcriptional regulator [Gallibacterium salpingitidis]OBX08522.1 DNA-binding protein [Gallibacterium salpingitidis]OBX11622.1 DNA-binding protein [Gallibacterium salpingitidis]WKS99033.1 AlpA family transcriptional regulator [Gallibacterium salpingitidis]
MSENQKKQRFINLDEVKDRTSLKKTTIYTLMNKNEFPQSISISANRSAWLESEIDDWIESKINTNKGNH